MSGPDDEEDDLELFRDRAERVGGRPGNRLGELEELVVLGLAEIRAAEEFLEADDLRPAARRIANPFNGMRQVGRGVRGGALLDQAERHCARCRHGLKIVAPEPGGACNCSRRRDVLLVWNLPVERPGRSG